MSWQPGIKPMGVLGKGPGTPSGSQAPQKKSAMKWAAKAAYQHHQNRDADDRDKSAARRAWAVDHVYGVAVAALLLVLLVGGVPIWMLAVVLVVAVAVTRIPAVRIVLQRRIIRRKLAREWEGLGSRVGIAQGVGLVSAGLVPGVVRIHHDDNGEMLLDLRLVPGLTVKSFESKGDELRSALGAAYIGFEQVGFDVIRLSLRSKDPLDGAVEASWASGQKVPVSMPVEDENESPWWERVREVREDEEP